MGTKAHETTEEKAIEWVKKHKQEIKSRFASVGDFPPVENPFSVFMAGAPGVGKTEVFKSFIEVYYRIDSNNKIVRVDTDEIRELIPGYKGANAPLLQRAAALGIEYVIDSCHINSQNIFIDTTFGLLEKAQSNIKRALGRNRKTGIFYLYQDPLISWDFTRKREALEGRVVPVEFFVDSLFSAKQNVNKIKSIFGNKINLSVLILDENHNITFSRFNVDGVDNYVKIPYTKEELFERLL